MNSEKANTSNPSNTNSLQITTFNTPLSKNLLQPSNQIKNPSNPSIPTPSTFETGNLVVSSSPFECNHLTCNLPSLISGEHRDVPSNTPPADSTSSSLVNHHYTRSPDPPNLVTNINILLKNLMASSGNSVDENNSLSKLLSFDENREFANHEPRTLQYPSSNVTNLAHLP